MKPTLRPAQHRQASRSSSGIFAGSMMREWRRIRHDETQRTLLFVLAPLLAVIFCTLYVKGSVADLPVAVCDFDRSSLSVSIARSVDATKSMNVVVRVTSPEELQQGIIRGDFSAGIIFPQGMMSNIKASRQPSVRLYCNGTNYLAAATINREVQTIVKTFSAGVLRTRLARSGMPLRQATTLVSPVTIDLSYCYNPAMSYSDYLVPGLVFAQFGALLILSGALVFSRKRHSRIIPQRRGSCFIASFTAATGTFIPYFLIALTLSIAILFILFPLFHIGSIAGALRALLPVLLFITASWWFGAAIGSITGQPMTAASFSAGLGIPSFLFSGWTFPLPAAPGIYTAIASVLPFTHFMPLWFDTMMKNLPVSNHAHDAALLIVTSTAGAVITSLFMSVSPEKRSS